MTHLSFANSLYHLGLQLAGSVTAVFNCQGPLDAPVFVGSCMVSRKIAYLSPDLPASVAYESMLKNKEAGAVAAFDRVPFSYLSANFTFNTDNCVSIFGFHLLKQSMSKIFEYSHISLFHLIGCGFIWY